MASASPCCRHAGGQVAIDVLRIGVRGSGFDRPGGGAFGRQVGWIVREEGCIREGWGAGIMGWETIQLDLGGRGEGCFGGEALKSSIPASARKILMVRRLVSSKLAPGGLCTSIGGRF
jgi:hypothetical protein